MVGGDVEFMVMVNVMGIPSQVVPALIKLPIEYGFTPTLTLVITELTAVLITETSFELKLVTYNKLPSELTDNPKGSEPELMVATIVLLAVLITETFPNV